VFLALTGYFGGFDLGLSQGTLRHVAIAHAAGRAEESSAHATFAALGYLALGALWLVVLSVAELMAKAISNIHEESSVTSLFV